MVGLTSTDPPPRDAGASTPAVAAVVIADEAELTAPCLEAIGRQVYGPAQVVVVGGDDEVRRLAGEAEARWRPAIRDVGDALLPEVEALWIVRGRARPRPDALRALAADLERVDAAIAGSKILDADDPEVLVAVGYATDVFDAPYPGLQPGEVDQQQYDVVRDVAAVSGVSMLVRRDLFRGLRGPDRALAPTAAAIDLCQRARLRGARVVVAPASEVLYQGPPPAPEWRERAGEIRAMLKVYSPITLLWAVPLAFLSGLVEVIAAPFLGSWRVLGFLGAWLWNVTVLPTTVKGRIEARRGRVVGDEELFRYQINGSARLKLLYDRGLERIRHRFPEGVLAGFVDVVESGQQRLRKPAVVAGMFAVLFAVVATRGIWSGRLPVVGFSLPPHDDAVETLRAYAGGWNPAGLGSLEVLRPEIGATALVQAALFDRAGAAVAVLTVAAFLAGVFGVARLLRVWGIGSVAGLAAGGALMAGPAAAALGESTQWSAIIALGALPWAVAAPLAPWPDGRPQRAARIAWAGLAVGGVGVFAPAALPVPLAAVAVWAAVGRGARWPALARAAVATAIALPLLMPWVLYADLGALYTTGEAAFWEPSLVAVALTAAALVGGLFGGDRSRAAVAGWGGILAVGGALVGRAGDLGAGREAAVAGLLAASLGTAVVVGAAFDAFRRRTAARWARRAAAVGGAIAALLALVTVAVPVGEGRAGLPEDDLTDRFAFAAAADGGTTRVLLFGDESSLPGTSRRYEGLGYRVFSPPAPESWDARLGEPRLGDEALVALFDDLVDGRVRRAGARLAEFGIEWVVFVEDSPLATLLAAQLDLVPVTSLDFPVFRNEVPTGRAVGEDGVVWVRDGTGYRRPDGASAGSVFVAENADFRWGPGDWEQEDWANSVTAAGDTVDFAGHSGRRALAITAAAWLGVLLVTFAVVGRWGR